jgi:phage FluMu gp28-like protein
VNSIRQYFLPYQCDWIFDQSPLKIIEKSRQIGITYADAYDSVIKASRKVGGWTCGVSSRDEVQSKLYLEDCKYWANFLHIANLHLRTRRGCEGNGDRPLAFGTELAMKTAKSKSLWKLF